VPVTAIRTVGGMSFGLALAAIVLVVFEIAVPTLVYPVLPRREAACPRTAVAARARPPSPQLGRLPPEGAVVLLCEIRVFD
jgi:hypothetical protein